MTDENITIITEDEIAESAKKNNVTPIRPVNLDDYPAISSDELQKDTPKVKPYILSPILRVQGICWVYAPTGLGKTLFTLNLAYCIANGGSFLKYSCPQPKKVLYVDGEMPYDQLYQRFMDIQKQQGELDFPENLYFLTPDKLSPKRVPKIDTLEGQTYYKKRLLEGKFDVIVFDNLAMLSSIDTNKATEWSPIQDWILDLRANDITTIIIHHSGKDQAGFRGSSTLIDCADTAIFLAAVNGNEQDEDMPYVKKFNIFYQKNRGFYGKDALAYEVQFFNGVWTYQSFKQTTINRIRELLLLGMSQRDIAKEIGFSLGKANKVIQDGRNKGILPPKALA